MLEIIFNFWEVVFNSSTLDIWLTGVIIPTCMKLAMLTQYDANLFADSSIYAIGDILKMFCNQLPVSGCICCENESITPLTPFIMLEITPNFWEVAFNSSTPDIWFTGVIIPVCMNVAMADQ